MALTSTQHELAGRLEILFSPKKDFPTQSAKKILVYAQDVAGDITDWCLDANSSLKSIIKPINSFLSHQGLKNYAKISSFASTLKTVSKIILLLISKGILDYSYRKNQTTLQENKALEALLSSELEKIKLEKAPLNARKIQNPQPSEIEQKLLGLEKEINRRDERLNELCLVNRRIEVVLLKQEEELENKNRKLFASTLKAPKFFRIAYSFSEWIFNLPECYILTIPIKGALSIASNLVSTATKLQKLEEIASITSEHAKTVQTLQSPSITVSKSKNKIFLKQILKKHQANKQELLESGIDEYNAWIKRTLQLTDFAKLKEELINAGIYFRLRDVSNEANAKLDTQNQAISDFQNCEEIMEAYEIDGVQKLIQEQYFEFQHVSKQTFLATFKQQLILPLETNSLSTLKFETAFAMTSCGSSIVGTAALIILTCLGMSVFWVSIALLGLSALLWVGSRVRSFYLNPNSQIEKTLSLTNFHKIRYEYAKTYKEYRLGIAMDEESSIYARIQYEQTLLALHFAISNCSPAKYFLNNEQKILSPELSVLFDSLKYEELVFELTKRAEALRKTLDISETIVPTGFDEKYTLERLNTIVSFKSKIPQIESVILDHQKEAQYYADKKKLYEEKITSACIEDFNSIFQKSTALKTQTISELNGSLVDNVENYIEYISNLYIDTQGWKNSACSLLLKKHFDFDFDLRKLCHDKPYLIAEFSHLDAQTVMLVKDELKRCIRKTISRPISRLKTKLKKQKKALHS